jgi:hypothetical protein
MTWSTTLRIYFLPIRQSIYLINYLPTYYPPTHPPIIYQFTYLLIFSHLPIYILTYVFHFRITYLPTYPLPIYYLLIYPPIYLFNSNH